MCVLFPYQSITYILTLLVFSNRNREHLEYKILEKIGEGSFSEVLKCQDRLSGALYAAKRLKKTYQK